MCVLFYICSWVDFVDLTWECPGLCIYDMSFEMSISLWQSLTVQRWPCAADRTLKYNRRTWPQPRSFRKCLYALWIAAHCHGSLHTMHEISSILVNESIKTHRLLISDLLQKSAPYNSVEVMTIQCNKSIPLQAGRHCARRVKLQHWLSVNSRKRLKNNINWHTYIEM